MVRSLALLVVLSLLQALAGCAWTPAGRLLDEGDALYRKGDVEGAMERYGRVLESDPDHPRALYSMGVAHYTLDDPAAALEHFDRSVDLDPSRAAYRLQRGHALVKLRRFDRAIDEYRTVIEIDPGMHEAFYAIGVTYYNARDYGAAARWLNRYLEVAPRAADRERVEQLIRSLEEWDR